MKHKKSDCNICRHKKSVLPLTNDQTNIKFGCSFTPDKLSAVFSFPKRVNTIICIQNKIDLAYFVKVL